MAFPVIVDQQTTTNSTTGALTMPSASVGNLLLAVCGSSAAQSTIAGWTTVGAASFGTTTKLTVLGKTAAGSDSLTIAASSKGVGAFITSFSGWSGLVSDIVLATVSGSLDPPSVNMVTSDDYEFLCGAFNFTNLITAAPANYTNFTTSTYSSTTTSDNNQKMAIARRALTATSEDPGIFAGTSNFSGAWTLGVVPVASAASPPQALQPMTARRRASNF